jgi:murein DD-endopeptidase MepM/ murein hydrolase activator NlpD
MAAAKSPRLALSIAAIALVSSAGPWAPIAAASSPYLLPLQVGSHVIVTQGNGGGHTNKEFYAWDFAVFGSSAEFPVVAARGGTVIGLEAGYKTSQSCKNLGCWTLANYVLIDHGDNTSALYLHLAEGSIKVALGQKVTQGKNLGDADCTGWSTGNHLHFQVEQAPSKPVLDQVRADKAAAGWWFTQSISITFADPSVLARDPNGIPTYADSFPGGYVSSNGAAQDPVQPPAQAAAKPGGTWISPDEGSAQSWEIDAAAHAYPSTSSKSPIDHVNFTIWWPDLGPKSGQWKTACSVRQPTSGDEYDCTFDPVGLGAPFGTVWLSFDVYDKSGASNLSPNGERSVEVVEARDVIGDGWQTYQGDGYQVDYPGPAVTVPSQSTGLYSVSASYYLTGSQSDPDAVYLVERISFPSGLLSLYGDDFTPYLKQAMSSYAGYSGGTTSSPRDVTVDGRPGLEITSQGTDGAYADGEIVIVGDEMYMIVDGYYPDRASIDTATFFASFHLD